MKLLENTLVQIKKPTIPYERWTDEWKIVIWDDDMDRFDGQIDRVDSCVGDFKYHLKRNKYYWHPDWLVVVSIDKHGNINPIGNDENSFCHWCKISTKTTIEKFAHGTMTFRYCPKCKR